MTKDILVMIGNNTAVIAAIAWTTKRIITYYLSKDIEAFKQELQQKMELALIEHDAVFRSLHTKRAETIEKVYKHLVELQKSLNFLNNGIQNQIKAGAKLSISNTDVNNVVSKIKKLDDIVGPNKLFFNKAHANSLQLVIHGCLAIPMIAEVARTGETKEYPVDLQEELKKIDVDTVHEKINALVLDTNKAIGVIEDAFRKLIGPKLSDLAKYPPLDIGISC